MFSNIASFFSTGLSTVSGFFTGIFSWFSDKIIIILAVIVVLMIIGGYFYFNWSQSKIDKLDSTVAAQTVAVQQQQSTIADLYNKYAALNKALSDYQNSINQIQAQTDSLKKQLQTTKTTVDSTASKKPAKVEKLINNQSDKLLNNIMDVTGSGAK